MINYLSLFYGQDFLPDMGKCPDAKALSKIKVSGSHIEWSHHLSIFTEISSSP